MSAPADVDAAAQAEIARFAGDLLVTAGAGTGKTHALIGLYLRLVAGTTELGQRVPPGRIAALTFTDKAAAEMRARVRARVIALADAPRGDADLERAYADRGVPPLSAGEWDAVLTELGAASISTFHAFAGTAIRRTAAELGIDPAFKMIEDAPADALLGDAVQTVALAALERDSGVRALMRELELSSEGFGAGLVQLLTTQVRRLGEEAGPPGTRPALAADPAGARAAFAGARVRLAAALEDARRWAGKRAERQAALARTAAVLARCPESPDAGGREGFDLALAELCSGERGPEIAELRRARELVSETAGDLTGAPQAAALAGLAAEARALYQSAKAARGVLDFSDLMGHLRALALAPALRAELAGRFDAILVDEYQDVSPVQGQLIDALASRGARRFLVGDRKQSIYDFRGADVAVFARAQEPLEARGGRRVVLRQNRRSRPGVLAFANRLFARTLTQTRHDFDVCFGDEDRLAPTRGGDGPAVELLAIEPDTARSSAETRKLEAAALARRIDELVAAGAPAIEPRGRPPRPPRYGDVAVLLRRFSHLDVYLAALRARGIPTTSSRAAASSSSRRCATSARR